MSPQRSVERSRSGGACLLSVSSRGVYSVSSSGEACLLSVPSRGVAFRQVEGRVSSAFRRAFRQVERRVSSAFRDCFGYFSLVVKRTMFRLMSCVFSIWE